MGQRLQVFVVARISIRTGVSRYKCVAAYHHQWCFGTLPLRALHRFFTLVRQRENAAVVRDELCLVDQKSLGLVSLKPAVNEDPAVPCPYLASLLAISWSTDLDVHQSYIGGNSLYNGLLDVRDDCWKKCTLNDEGICVIDLSSIESPAYCFVPNSRSPVMTAYEYIRLKMFLGSFTEAGGQTASSESDSVYADSDTSEDAGAGECYRSLCVLFDSDYQS
ncbi:hypothetical protein BV20DRAFT_955257 [Pilatotrama ljubarskyi]|nr:hypothetical protein BV20DRAFT_955257 [Pilatotrama ljubarskyi]